jgi:hypothetical protein
VVLFTAILSTCRLAQCASSPSCDAPHRATCTRNTYRTCSLNKYALVTDSFAKCTTSSRNRILHEHAWFLDGACAQGTSPYLRTRSTWLWVRTTWAMTLWKCLSSVMTSCSRNLLEARRWYSLTVQCSNVVAKLRLVETNFVWVSPV